MGKLFVATAIGAAVCALAAAAAQAMPQPEPDARLIPVKVEQVTAAAHVTYRDPDHNAVVESSLVMVGEVPALASGGCRMRDTAQDAAPAPKSPTSTPRTPPRGDEMSPRPKGRWIVCS